MILNIFVTLLLTEKIALYYSHDSAIPAVTEEEFTKIHSEKKYSVVMIYAPWCQHCQHFMPVFDQFIEESKSKMPEVQVAKIDGTTQAEFAKRQQITGYPTILLFRSDKVCKYQGERKLETLVNWTKGMITPSTIDSPSDVESAISAQPAFVVYTSGDSADLKELMMDLVCQGKISAPGGVHYVSSQEVADKLKLTKGRSLFVVKSGSEPKAFEGGLNEKEISLFLAFSSTPLLLQYSQANSPSIFSAAIENYLFVLLNLTQNKYEQFSEMFEKIAKAQSGKVRMSWIDVDSEDGKMACQFFGISDAPAAILFNSTSSLIYSERSSSILEETAITSFVEKYLDRQLKPHRKEQPLPENWNTGPVFHLVASNFEEVRKWGQPLFVMFFAPWCGHCKKLHPDWERLGQDYNQVEKEKRKVIIAQVDATLNDIEGVTVEHFPTLIVFMPDGSQVTYDGNRSYGALRMFIELDFQKVKKPEDSAEKAPSKEQTESHEAETKGREEAKVDATHDEL